MRNRIRRRMPRPVRLPALLLLVAVLLMPPAFAAEDSCAVRAHANRCRKIALTFDDGPHPVYTPELLDLLSAYHIPATFFVVGENAARYPELILREINEGHEIGNHTYSHARLTQLAPTAAAGEIGETEKAIGDIIEYRPHLLRPPEGRYGARLASLASENDYTLILWSLDTEDWRGRPADEISAAILDGVEAGDIILCHDYIVGKSGTAEALHRVIPALLAQGYRFVTVSELIGSN